MPVAGATSSEAGSVAGAPNKGSKGSRRGKGAGRNEAGGGGRGNHGKGGDSGKGRGRGNGDKGNHGKGRGRGEATSSGDGGNNQGKGRGRGEAASPSSKHSEGRGRPTPGKGQGDRCESREAAPEGSVDPPPPRGVPLDEPARRAALHDRLCEPALPALPAHPWDVMSVLQGPSPTELRLAASLPAEERDRNIERQAEERMVLEAIYADELCPVERGAGPELIEVRVALQGLPTPARLEVPAALLSHHRHARAAPPSDDEVAREVRTLLLPVLPPLRLRLRLPCSYPSCAPPAFGLCCSWLSDEQLATLCRRLDGLWEAAATDAPAGEGAQVLCEWVEWLKDEALGSDASISAYLGSDAVPRVAAQPVRLPAAPCALPAAGECRALLWPRTPPQLLSALLAHGESAEEEAWARATHACSVCMEEHASLDCVRFLRCRHTFCRGCVSGYFTSQMGEGKVGGMVCPDPACKMEATPDEVRQCLSAEDWERFEHISLQTSLAGMKDMVWCPRCQYPALLQEEGGRLALCGKCQFSFCAECQQTWHGLAPCANLSMRWRAADEAGKEVLRRKYGDKILQEVESSAWVSEHTKPCPRCSAATEKNGGCNHITCRKCSHEWCWLCTSTYTQAHALQAPCIFLVCIYDAPQRHGERFRVVRAGPLPQRCVRTVLPRLLRRDQSHARGVRC